MDTDAKETTKDALPKVGQPSGEGTPKPSTPPTYTKEQADKLADEKHAKLDTKIADQAKALSRSTVATEAAERRATTAEGALAERDRAADRKELDAAQGDGDALAKYTAKVAARDERAELKKGQDQLDADKRDHATEIEDARGYKVLKLANDIAAELSVDANQLISLTDGSEEKMRKAAEILPKVGQTQAPTKIPDSGEGAGAAKKLSEMTTEEQEAISDDEWFKRREQEDREKEKEKRK